MAGGAEGADAVAVCMVVVWEVDAIVRIAGVWRMAKSSGDGCGESKSDSSSLPSSVSGSSSSGVGSGRRTVAAWLVMGSVSETSCAATLGVGGPR